jgi:hypothetical protein
MDYNTEVVVPFYDGLIDINPNQECKNYASDTALVNHRSALVYDWYFSSPKAPAGSITVKYCMAPLNTPRCGF